MADEPAIAAETIVAETVKDESTTAPEEMDVETLDSDAAVKGGKRERDEEVNTESPENGNDAKKPKVEDEEKSVEEQRLEKEETKTGPVSLGFKNFETSVEMFDYFYKFLHFWPQRVNVNTYEHTMLLDLLKKGHLEAEKKIGAGIKSFQVRYHPQWKSRCFFLVREDDSSDDFSFRKCVDHILPLPENMVVKTDVNKALGGGHGHGGGRGGVRGNWRGGGRGGKRRN